MEVYKKDLLENSIKEKLKIFGNFVKNKLKDIDCILIKNGENLDDIFKIKTVAFQSYLFRTELYDTIFLITKQDFIIIGKNLRLKVIESFKDDFLESDYKLKIYNIEDNDFEKKMKLLKEFISTNIKNYGCLIKEKPVGKLIESFYKIFNNIEVCDISGKIQEFLCIKFHKDLNLVKANSKLNINLFNKLINEVEDIVDQSKNMKHSQISFLIDDYLVKNKDKLSNICDLKENCFDLAYSPIIQSGNCYVLKPNAESNDNVLSPDIITLSIGCKYYEFHTNIIRTLIVDGNTKVKDTYNILFEAHLNLIRLLKPGSIIKDIYKNIKKLLISKDKSLESNIPTNFGYGIGYEFRENVLLINEKNNNEIKENMIFHATMNIGNILNQKAIMIGDTVIITKDGNDNLTKSVVKKYDTISYTIRKDEVENEKKVDNIKQEITKDDKKMTRAQIRNKRMQENELKTLKIKDNQKNVFANKTKEIIERYESGNFLLNKNVDNTINLIKINSYTEKTFPKNLNINEIHIDQNHFSVLLPINNRLVPFHIICIKNASKFNEGNIFYLRINFQYPGSGNTNITFPDFKSLNSKPIFLKELTFKSTNGGKFNEILVQIKNLQKKFKEKDLNDMHSGNNIKPEQLHIKIKTLNELKIRPNISGRKTIGNLIAYTNGFKYQSKKGEEIVISSTNIKHAFYQPCDNEMIILIHFNLKKPMIIGKKSTIDVQFYTEIGTVTEDLMDRRRYNEADELHQEELEEQAKIRFNEDFKTFVQLIEKNNENNLKIDIPYKNLGFYGSPFHSSCFISPTVNCLVSLIEVPFLVVSLNDIEIVSLERVDTKLKNFDLIIVFKDYTKPVKTITSICKSNLDFIKEWIDSINIPIIEGGNINMNWVNLLKRIREDPEEFINEKCWEAFLDDEESQELEESSFSEGSEFNKKEEGESSSDFEEESDFTDDEEDLNDEEEDDEDEKYDEEDESDNNKKRK